MRENKEALLISGTGGAYTIRGRDLKDSLFDPEMREQLIEQFYTQDGVQILPENAFYYDGDRKVKLLRRNQSGYPPLVTRTLEDILEKHDITYHSIPCDTIWENLPFERESVDCVCLSTTFMWSEKMIERAVQWVKEHVDFKYFLVGGHYSSIKYQQILERYEEIDFVIIGDGETALPMLIRNLQGEESSELSQIPNLAYIRDGRLVLTPHKYEDISEMPKVSYAGTYERLSYESVRGCAFGCKFCTWDAGIKHFRFKSAERIVQDVREYIEENHIKRIEINDSTFFFPFIRIDKIVEGFTELGIHWKAHCRADVPWTDELIEKLNRSNCDILQIGFETMNDRILKNMSKKTTAEMNRFTNNMLAKTKIDTVVSFMIGFPDESVEEFSNTWNYLLEEFQGHFYLFVFEMEDKSLDLWKQREQYGFELFKDKDDCVHGGHNWRHNGMTSDQAFELRDQVLKSVRRTNSKAIYKSWQSPYEWPFVSDRSREENIRIERLIDNLVFLVQDVDRENLFDSVKEIREKLKEYYVYFED